VTTPDPRSGEDTFDLIDDAIASPTAEVSGSAMTCPPSR
jgi:hypothetical protein